MSVDLNAAQYVPTIFLRPAEMAALKELPEEAKDLLCPIFCLRPWLASKVLDSSLDQIKKVYGDREYFLDIDPFVKFEGELRPAQVSFQKLVDKGTGHIQWTNFFEQVPKASPCVLTNHGDLAGIEYQIGEFSKIGKFFLVKLSFTNSIDFVSIVDAVCKVDHANFGFVLDAGWSPNLILRELWVDDLVKAVVDRRGGDIPVVVTGSSFPRAFTEYGIGDSVGIEERALFDRIRAKHNRARLIYGDWASSRSPMEQKGGASIPPRIDLPLGRSWEIFRVTEDEGFKKAATAARNSKNFPKDLQIWSTYKLEATEKDKPDRIANHRVAAAVRINLHLYRQLHYDKLELPPPGDEDYHEV